MQNGGTACTRVHPMPNSPHVLSSLHARVTRTFCHKDNDQQAVLTVLTYHLLSRHPIGWPGELLGTN